MDVFDKNASLRRGAEILLSHFGPTGNCRFMLRLELSCIVVEELSVHDAVERLIKTGIWRLTSRKTKGTVIEVVFHSAQLRIENDEVERLV